MNDTPSPPEGPCAATPAGELERQIMNCNVPKNEREWWAAREIEKLRRWQQEQLTVAAWWQEIDDYVRKSPDAQLGDHVSATALLWLKQRMSLKQENEQLRACLGAALRDCDRMDWLEAHPLSTKIIGGADDGHTGTFWGLGAHSGTLRMAIDRMLELPL